MMTPLRIRNSMSSDNGVIPILFKQKIPKTVPKENGYGQQCGPNVDVNSKTKGLFIFVPLIMFWLAQIDKERA